MGPWLVASGPEPAPMSPDPQPWSVRGKGAGPDASSSRGPGFVSTLVWRPVSKFKAAGYPWDPPPTYPKCIEGPSLFLPGSLCDPSLGATGMGNGARRGLSEPGENYFGKGSGWEAGETPGWVSATPAQK